MRGTRWEMRSQRSSHLESELQMGHGKALTRNGLWDLAVAFWKPKWRTQGVMCQHGEGCQAKSGRSDSRWNWSCETRHQQQAPGGDQAAEHCADSIDGKAPGWFLWFWPSDRRHEDEHAVDTSGRARQGKASEGCKGSPNRGVPVAQERRSKGEGTKRNGGGIENTTTRHGCSRSAAELSRLRHRSLVTLVRKWANRVVPVIAVVQLAIVALPLL
jgi:hypothetical protein